MDSNLALLRRKVCQQINREAHEPGKRTAYRQGYIAALARVVHLIDKMKNADTDDYDEHRHSGLLEEE